MGIKSHRFENACLVFIDVYLHSRMMTSSKMISFYERDIYDRDDVCMFFIQKPLDTRQKCITFNVRRNGVVLLSQTDPCDFQKGEILIGSSFPVSWRNHLHSSQRHTIAVDRLSILDASASPAHTSISNYLSQNESTSILRKKGKDEEEHHHHHHQKLTILL